MGGFCFFLENYYPGLRRSSQLGCNTLGFPSLLFHTLSFITIVDFQTSRLRNRLCSLTRALLVSLLRGSCYCAVMLVHRETNLLLNTLVLV
jgi:hypothetical protein